MFHSKYIEYKAEAYRQMNVALKSTEYLCVLSDIYNALQPIQRYAVAVDTFDYMFDDDGFSHWYFSDYAQITMSVLQELFCVAVTTIDDIDEIRVIYSIERAIEKSRWLLKDKQEDDLDPATAKALDEIQLEYRRLRPQFIAVMKQWFETQA
jgi:hypothetical protein